MKNIGQFHARKGLKFFSFDPKTGEVAEIKTERTGPERLRGEIPEGRILIQALNLKNAARKASKL